jgi:adenine phosphoribosyltransferase
VSGDQLGDVARGRAALLNTFAWHDGHADVWRVFRDAHALADVVRGLVAPYTSLGVTAITGIEGRGFLLGGAAAMQLGVGFVAIRKEGALLPGAKVRHTTDPDYRGHRHELLLQRDTLSANDRVLLVDDWAETGSQARAARHLVQACGAELVGVSVMIDQLTAEVRRALPGFTALAPFADLPVLDASHPSGCG